MALFDKIGNVAKNAAAGAGEMVETAKLNARIGDENKKIGNIKSQLGDYVWQQYAAGQDLPEGMLQYCRQIDACNEQIAAYNMQLAELKAPAPAVAPQAAPAAAASSAAACLSCGAAIAPNSRFCPVCGAEQVAPEPEPAVPGEKFCTNCGAKISADTRFCPECGQAQ